MSVWNWLQWKRTMSVHGFTFNEMFIQICHNSFSKTGVLKSSTSPMFHVGNWRLRLIIHPWSQNQQMCVWRGTGAGRDGGVVWSPSRIQIQSAGSTSYNYNRGNQNIPTTLSSVVQKERVAYNIFAKTDTSMLLPNSPWSEWVKSLKLTSLCYFLPSRIPFLPMPMYSQALWLLKPYLELLSHHHNHTQ